MKQTLTLLILCILSTTSWAQFNEDFSLFTAVSYTTGDITLSSGVWNVQAALGESSANSLGGTGRAVRMNGNIAGAHITTPELTNGAGTVTFWYREAFSGGGTFSLQTSKDGVNYTTQTTQAFSGTNYTQFTFDLNDNSPCLTIRIESDNQPGNLIIDDFSVTAPPSPGGQLNEDFSLFTDVGYTTGAILLSGGYWTVQAALGESSANSLGGTGRAVRMNNNTAGASITTPTMTNGVGTITFWYREAFSGGGTFSLQTSTNGVNYTIRATQAFSGTTYTQFTIDLDDISPCLTIRIVSDNQSGNLIIDDFSATEFPLPISLTSFIAKKVNATVLLKWTTATEINNDYMAVERSTDGRNFMEIGRVQGAGTVETAQNYQLIDEKPRTGLNYYRLKQVDFDSEYEYHQIVSVHFDGSVAEPIRVYPTSTDDRLQIILSDKIRQRTSLQVVSVDGRIWNQTILPAGTVQTELSVNDLPSGNYWLRILDNQNVHHAYFQKL